MPKRIKKTLDELMEENNMEDAFDLAPKCGLKVVVVEDIIIGTKAPTYGRAVKIAKAFGVSPYDIIWEKTPTWAKQ